MDSKIVLSRKRFLNVSLLRGIACAGVLAVHIAIAMDLQGVVGSVLKYGAKGVYMFFILSGFLFAVSFYERGKKSSDILKDRMIHLLTLYYFFILIYFVVDTFFLHEAPLDSYHLGWMRYIFFLNVIFPQPEEFWYNIGMVWTIPVFAVSNIILSLSVTRIDNYKKALVFAFICTVFQLASRFFSGWFSIVNYYLYFAAGLLIFFSIRETREYQTITILIAFQILMLAAGKSISLYISIFAFCILIIATFHIPVPEGGLVERIARWFDRYSYSVYLSQGLVFYYLIERIRGTVSPLLIGVLAFSLTMILSISIHELYEKPLLMFLKKHL